jgi:hypothetical protein
MGHPPCRKGHERNRKGRTRQMPAQRFCDLDLSFRKLWVPDPLRHESVPRTRLTAALCGPRICPAHLIDCRRKGWVDRTSTLTFIRDKNVGAPSFAATIYFPYSTDCGRKGWVSKTFNPRGCSSLHRGCPILCGPQICYSPSAAYVRKGWVPQNNESSKSPTTSSRSHPKSSPALCHSRAWLSNSPASWEYCQSGADSRCRQESGWLRQSLRPAPAREDRS